MPTPDPAAVAGGAGPRARDRRRLLERLNLDHLNPEGITYGF